MHTSASGDYQELEVTYLDILRQAYARNLDIIGFTDHNTVAGYRAMEQEIAELELLERLKRLKSAEKQRLNECRRLLGSVLVLPGFEFTATFGFHILGVFAPDTAIRTIEHVLLSLNVPPEQLDKGSLAVGATADALTAYRLIDEAGGLAIAAHANSANGVAMRGFNYGGQTRIAYTQDPHLHALEVTDLGARRTTARFFNGSKPEYPRRMHCIQGSDAHRLFRDSNSPKHLGVGDRVTEALLEEVSFEALKQLFLSPDFARTRPYRGGGVAVDFVQTAREEGANIVQDFHEKMTQRGEHLQDIIADVCALANTNGGVVYVGVGRNAREKPVGVANVSRAVETLQAEIGQRITPSLACTVDALATQGRKIVRISVPRGQDPPYAIDDNKIYVRDESDTSLAVRDEIVQLVCRAMAKSDEAQEAKPTLEVAESPQVETVDPPRIGVEIVAIEERNGTMYHTVRDLRNGNQVKNVTRASSRRLWHYAILDREGDPDLKDVKVTWFGDLGLINKYQRGNVARFDLCQRTLDGGLRVYYGVTEDGIHGEWKRVAGGEEE